MLNFKELENLQKHKPNNMPLKANILNNFNQIEKPLGKSFEFI